MDSQDRKPVICFLCGDEIPTGWPVTAWQNDDGSLFVVHRFRNMCVTDRPPAESKEKDGRSAAEGENE